ncbi:MAG: nucleotide exchange factor GrpE [Rhodospirillales bacterium]|nr:nucleotide exchange factor GrpE [Rhodospirillales bacterium]
MQNEPEIEEPGTAAAAGAAAPKTPDELMRAATARIGELEEESQSFRDRWMRAEAEIANVRARAKREAEEARLFAVQAFARDIAEVAENLRRGLDSLPKPAAGEPEVVSRLREGFAGVERGLLAALERNGVRRTDPTGAAFDPNLHQAMAEQESEEHPPGTVLAAWTPAWSLNGRLLRPAMVVVAKTAPAELAGPGHGSAKRSSANQGAANQGAANLDKTA